MENIEYTTEGLLLASYKMAVNNNAMLKLILNNQIAIMTKLEVTPPDPRVFFEPEPKPNDPLLAEIAKSFLTLADGMESLSHDTAWNFAVSNDKNLDFDNEDLDT
jgi:hypothetical protein